MNGEIVGRTSLKDDWAQKAVMPPSKGIRIESSDGKTRVWVDGVERLNVKSVTFIHEGRLVAPTLTITEFLGG